MSEHVRSVKLAQGTHAMVRDVAEKYRIKPDWLVSIAVTAFDELVQPDDKARLIYKAAHQPDSDEADGEVPLFEKTSGGAA